MPPPLGQTEQLPKNNAVSAKKQFFDELNLFRGFAILCIVLGHARSYLGTFSSADMSTWFWGLERSYTGVVNGGTAYFVFISGFLFYALFYKRGFEYRSFMIGKVKKVFCPYVLITGLFLVYRLVRGHGSLSDPGFVWGTLLWGSFWYMPFVMLLFAVSPLFIAFIEAGPRVRWGVLLATLVFSMALGRHNLSPVLNVLFWSSTYLAGIQTALYYEEFKSARPLFHECLFWGTVLFLGFCAYTGYHYFEGHGNFDVSLTKRLELMTLGKIMIPLCCLRLFLAVGKGAGHPVRFVWELLAKYSFSIFFLHNLIIFWYEQHPHKAFFHSFNRWGIEGTAVLATIVTCILCIAVAALVKKLTGRYSRMIIGA